MSTSANPAGLEDVVAGNSSVCFIDGKEGRLVYQGYDIHDLAAKATFEEVVYLLWHGKLPNQAQLDDLKQQLSAARALPAAVLNVLKGLPKDAHPMEALRTGVSLLGMYDPDSKDMSREANLRKAIRLTAQVGTISAAWGRIATGKEPVAPRTDLSHAGNFLYMLTGEVPGEYETHVFDVCLTLHADHELNASTFSARVTAGTLSDLHSAITSAVGTLKGPLHGGANEQVMLMLLEIGSVANAEAWITDALAKKKKVMGFGHRVYKTMDPRAVWLRQFSEEMGKRAGETKWFEISEVVHRVVHEQKGLYPNVDFYSASTYYTMGIPTDLFTPIFATSRISGWTAHVLEQYDNNRLIRPRAEYVGPNKLEWVPIEQRG